MFSLKVEKCFWASHCLRLPEGKKQPRHHHNWTVTVKVSRHQLDGSGLVMDFSVLEKLLEDIICEFDNSSLQEREYFARNNPTAENVAKYVYERIETELPEKVRLDNVTVTEQPGCWARFER
mgnify:CR=1 FL=1